MPKTKVLVHPVPQDHKSGQDVASRQNLLEDLAQNLSQKDEASIKVHLTQGIVWNEGPGLLMLVSSNWSIKVGG